MVKNSRDTLGPMLAAVAAVVLVLAMTACGQTSEDVATDPAVPSGDEPAKAAAAEPAARAELQPTEGNDVHGTVAFYPAENGVRIEAEITGLAPGDHGFHVHEVGDCSAPDASSAGGHFAPRGRDHGAPDATERHVGDLGNVTADEAGKAAYERVDAVITLGDGANSILGKAVVVHAGADDLHSQPTGNAGGRVACGVIEKTTQSTGS